MDESNNQKQITDMTEETFSCVEQIAKELFQLSQFEGNGDKGEKNETKNVSDI